MRQDLLKHSQKYTRTARAPSPQSSRQGFASEEVEVETIDDLVRPYPHDEVLSYVDQYQTDNWGRSCS